MKKIFVLLILLLSITHTNAQDGILECLPYNGNDQIISLGRSVTEVSDWEWQGWLEIQGESIIEGDEYERGNWHVPLDVRLVLKIYNIAPLEEQWLVWVWYSPSTPDFTYWFLFPSVIRDENGNIHPNCGVYKVNLVIWR